MPSYLISNATLIDGNGQRRATLRTDGNHIAEIIPPGAHLADHHDCHVIDGTGHWLIPGAVDPHVHFALRTAAATTVDNFASGTRSALAGGTTSIIDFVTPERSQSLVAAAEARLEEAAHSCCDYALHASVTTWRSTTAAELEACRDRYGFRSLKLYLAYLETIGLADRDLAAAMQTAADLDLTVLMHCEDGRQVSRRQQELIAAGEHSPAAHPRSRPPAFEAAAVVRALELSSRTGCHPYIVHVSSADALNAITTARDRGQTVLAETCPQYLLLDESAYDLPFEQAAAHVVSPPLRGPQHLRSLREALARGDIDVVATDHCAFDHAQKERGRHDFTRIPGGAAGVEHRLALLQTLNLDPTDWVRLVSTSPARIFGLYPRKGSLEPGADADLVLWNPDAHWTIESARDHHPGDHSIYEGMAVRGRVEKVWLRGEMVVSGNIVTAGSGQGRFLLR